LAQANTLNPTVRRTVTSSNGSALLPSRICSSLPGHQGKEALERAGVKFNSVQKGYGDLQHVELPPGWSIQDHWLCADGLLHASLVSAGGRVCAVTRQHKRVVGIRAREVDGWSRMIVACPYVISFYRENRREIIPRIRKRYGGIVYTANIPRRDGEKRGQFKARAYKNLIDVLNVQFPDWKTASCS